MKGFSEHEQVRTVLYNFGEKRMTHELSKLAKLRKKADYNPLSVLAPNEVYDAVYHRDCPVIKF